MKYQIYLNKETTLIIDLLCKQTNQKPSHFIKGFLEESLIGAFRTTGLNLEDFKHGK